jgi:hypothetical protein
LIDKATFLKNIDDIYVTDAYHSLSIEKYKVTPELIEKVKSGKWNLGDNEEDKKHRDHSVDYGLVFALLATVNKPLMSDEIERNNNGLKNRH